MEEFASYLKDKIIKMEKKRWYFHMNLKYSSFTMTNTRFQEALITGLPCITPEECKINVNIHYHIGNSNHLHCVPATVKGYKEASEYLFTFTEKYNICTECAGIYKKENDDSMCGKCIFLRFYTKEKKINDVCTICQDPVFRTKLPCGHMFHTTCLLEMDKKDMSCPNCRMKIPAYIVNDLFGEPDNSDDEYSSASENEDDYNDENI